MSEKGKELEFIRKRLDDIVFLCENTAVAEGAPLNAYVQELKTIIVNQAEHAEAAMTLLDSRLIGGQ